MFVIRWGDGGQFDTLPFILKIAWTVKSGDRGTFLPIRGYCLCVGYHISAVMNSVVQTHGDRSTESSVLPNLTMSLLLGVQLLSLSIRKGFLGYNRKFGKILKNCLEAETRPVIGPFPPKLKVLNSPYTSTYKLY